MRFPTTEWTIIEAAGQSTSVRSQEAMEALCRIYWPAVLAYVRSRGHDSEQCLDLTQGFFTRLLEKKYIRNVRRARGRFRSYLLTCIKHYLADEAERSRALKRGGGRAPLPFAIECADDVLEVEPADPRTPEKVFEREWCLRLLRTAMRRLEGQAARSSRGAERFERLKPFLTGDATGSPYKQIAENLHMSEGAVKVAVHDLRRRFRVLLRAEVSRTVSDPESIEDEIRFLFRALST